jgi:hypothetical protein
VEQYAELKERFGDSLEIFKSNGDNREELLKILYPCHALYLAPDVFGIEFGKLFIDCAVQTKLERCIMTSRVDAETISNGAITLPSFSKCTELEKYTNLFNTSFMFKYFGFNAAYLIPGMQLVVRDC